MTQNPKTTACRACGARVMPLCRIHHGEVDTLGQTAFDELYHVVAVPMDKRIAAKYRISSRAAN